jgi:hypothetical protein
MTVRLTPWELRGYLTYPNHYGKPQPGTREEMNWSIGWARAQREDLENAKSQYHLDLEFDAMLGRDSYSAEYVPEREQKELRF